MSDHHTHGPQCPELPQRFIVTKNITHGCCHRAAVEDTTRLIDTVRIGDEVRHRYDSVGEFQMTQEAHDAADAMNFAPALAASLRTLLDTFDDGSDEPDLVHARFLLDNLPLSCKQ